VRGELGSRLAAGGEPVVDRLHAPPRVGLDIAARRDPLRAEARQALVDVDGDRRIGVGAGGVIHRQRRLRRGWMQLDLPHWDAQVGVQYACAMDLARGGKGFGNDVQQLRIHGVAPEKFTGSG